MSKVRVTLSFNLSQMSSIVCHIRLDVPCNAIRYNDRYLMFSGNYYFNWWFRKAFKWYRKDWKNKL